MDFSSLKFVDIMNRESKMYLVTVRIHGRDVEL
jgi:hypothetical protein